MGITNQRAVGESKRFQLIPVFAAKFFALVVDSSNSSAAFAAVNKVRRGCRAPLKLCPRPPNTLLKLASPLKC